MYFWKTTLVIELYILEREKWLLIMPFDWRLICLSLFGNTSTSSSETKGLSLEALFWGGFGTQYLQSWSKVVKRRNLINIFLAISWIRFNSITMAENFVSKEEPPWWSNSRIEYFRQVIWCCWYHWLLFKSAARFWQPQKKSLIVKAENSSIKKTNFRIFQKVLESATLQACLFLQFKYSAMHNY